MSPELLAVAAPLLFALLAFVVPSERARPRILPVAALCQVGIVGALLGSGRLAARGPDDWVGLDPLGVVLLGYLTVLFLGCACYAPGYLRLRSERKGERQRQ